ANSLGASRRVNGSREGILPGVRRQPPSATAGTKKLFSSTMQCAAHQEYSHGQNC
ncbi:hypothetical protein HAX54_023066, partial [Datura stramonium]|nr:hypothetical protein [Datura stramonium]